MEEQFRAILLADSGVSALVGSRVNFGASPQGAPLPYIVLNTISRVVTYNLEGPDSLTEYRVQVDCYGSTYAEATAVSRAVIAVLSGYSDADFQGIFLVASRDSREDAEGRPFRSSLDFTVMH